VVDIDVESKADMFTAVLLLPISAAALVQFRSDGKISWLTQETFEGRMGRRRYFTPCVPS
jgi:hypothetical protein